MANQGRNDFLMKLGKVVIGVALLWLLFRNRLEIKNVISELPRHAYKTFRSRDLADINEVTVHHSGTDSGSALSFANYHVTHNNWPGIGYHYVIYPNGEVEQTLDLTTIGAHDGGENEDSVGVVFIGNFDKTKPTTAALDSFHMLFRIIESVTGKRLKLEGHNENEVNHTNCPGKNFPIDELKMKLVA